MDKHWMECTNRLSDKYMKGVEVFHKFIFTHTIVEGVISCPYTKCNNVLHKARDKVYDHLLMFRIVKGYTRSLYYREFIA